MTSKQRYQDKMDQKKTIMLEAGLVADRYPEVASIVFNMTYYQNSAAPVLMTRTLNFYPTNYACFHMECMREECTNGGFDLAPVVADLVKHRKKSVKGKLKCNGNNAELRAGHASNAYEISIQYNKPVK